MSTRAWVIAGSLSLALGLVPLVAQQQRAARPGPPPGRPTDRPTAQQVASLKTGPPLPYKVDASWPQVPKGYNFGEASGVDVDPQGNVWVYNRGHWPVMEFDRAGKMLQAWSADTFAVKAAHGIRVGPDGNLWCVDVDGHLVLKVSPQGRILMVIGNRQGVPGNNDAIDAFYRPTNVGFAANGDIYVSDGYVNSRVIEFNPAGEFVRKWGSKGTGDGEFNLVHDVQVDKNGRVYVADRTNERIQVFDPSGKFLTKWTGIGAPWGIYYVAKENAIYMCDGKYDRVIKLNLEGQVLGVLGSWGKTPGHFDYVHSIAVDRTDGSIYTVEIKNWRVQKFIRQ
ncbi:MAG TPA: peptidyl-alpha-hydroxyglycine alpha-amidating lyase family protein [Bryobacteraceae bacterium]|nr:peptidyl-alpha-hydroxyglycine alpha-amidating lyase family protein [Bryobacteraceae bacterium]